MWFVVIDFDTSFVLSPSSLGCASCPVRASAACWSWAGVTLATAFLQTKPNCHDDWFMLWPALKNAVWSTLDPGILEGSLMVQITATRADSRSKWARNVVLTDQYWIPLQADWTYTALFRWDAVVPFWLSSRNIVFILVRLNINQNHS